MTTERVHLPVRRPLLETLLQSEMLAGLVALFRSVTHQPPPDLEIAWEDGEAEEETETRR
jgi:hypothetical protein